MIEPPMLYQEKMHHCGISISTKWAIFLLIVLWFFSQLLLFLQIHVLILFTNIWFIIDYIFQIDICLHSPSFILFFELFAFVVQWKTISWMQWHASCQQWWQWITILCFFEHSFIHTQNAQYNFRIENFAMILIVRQLTYAITLLCLSYNFLPCLFFTY
jgi:hypothetical protein